MAVTRMAAMHPRGDTPSRGTLAEAARQRCPLNITCASVTDAVGTTRSVSTWRTHFLSL
eukprot:CAMPEP_0174700370 /NCGR_PEP_ID=MMETSP1094-20130205/5338_1 /TAXON_ID=156173 /ORGANISM="Chrysochromulina brevifilum, Strain UTEX LB 985" /LENGTH=58 /DNA_ID=CAMNT_0015897835 /DNA_START=173 /DNA_END=349 /DNA_ORIENTATION=+